MFMVVWLIWAAVPCYCHTFCSVLQPLVFLPLRARLGRLTRRKQALLKNRIFWQVICSEKFTEAEEHQLWHEGQKRELGAAINPNSTPWSLSTVCEGKSASGIRYAPFSVAVWFVNSTSKIWWLASRKQQADWPKLFGYFSHLSVAANGHGSARECTLPDPCEVAVPNCPWLPPSAGERMLGCHLFPSEIHARVPLHSVWAFKGGVNSWMHCETTWQRVHHWFGPVKHWKMAGRGKMLIQQMILLLLFWSCCFMTRWDEICVKIPLSRVCFSCTGRLPEDKVH